MVLPEQCMSICFAGNVRSTVASASFTSPSVLIDEVYTELGSASGQQAASEEHSSSTYPGNMHAHDYFTYKLTYVHFSACQTTYFPKPRFVYKHEELAGPAGSVSPYRDMQILLCRFC